jgi:hypothetical protein
MREYRRAGRRKQLNRFAAQLRSARSLKQAAGLIAGMVARFGGLDAFVRLWGDSLQTGSPATKLRAFRALVEMLERLEARQTSEVSQLSDAEIERELRALLWPVAGVLD